MPLGSYFFLFSIVNFIHCSFFINYGLNARAQTQSHTDTDTLVQELMNHCWKILRNLFIFFFGSRIQKIKMEQEGRNQKQKSLGLFLMI